MTILTESAEQREAGVAAWRSASRRAAKASAIDPARAITPDDVEHEAGHAAVAGAAYLRDSVEGRGAAGEEIFDELPAVLGLPRGAFTDGASALFSFRQEYVADAFAITSGFAPSYARTLNDLPQILSHKSECARTPLIEADRRAPSSPRLDRFLWLRFVRGRSAGSTTTSEVDRTWREDVHAWTTSDFSSATRFLDGWSSSSIRAMKGCAAPYEASTVQWDACSSRRWELQATAV